MQPGYGAYPGQQPYPGQAGGAYPSGGYAGYGYPAAAPPAGPGYPAGPGFMAGQPPYGSSAYPTAGAAEMGNDSFEGDMSAFGSKEVRMGFIRKVYSILSAQLVVTFGFILIFSLSDGAKTFAKANSGLLIVSFVVSIVAMLVLACCGEVRRKFPMNFVCLTIFTLAQAFMLGFVTAFYKTNIVLLAVLMTAVVCIGITIFSFQTKIDFTVYSGVMFVAVLILMVMGIVLMFVKIPILHLIYASLGALIFSIYLIIDTQMIIGGTHKNQISPEEYIFAAISLYTDILNIFLYILQILQFANSD